MVAVVIAILYNSFSNIGWIQFIESTIIIVPAMIGLMVQPNSYCKRTTLKIVAVMNPIFKRKILNNVKTNSFVKRFIITALTIKSLIVKRIYSTGVAAIMFFVKKPFCIGLPLFCILASINCILLFNWSYSSRTIEAAYLSLMILTATFTNINFGRGLILVTSFFCILFSCITVYVIPGRANIYNDPLIFVVISSVILNCSFVVLRDIRSREIVFIAVGLSITVLTHDVVSLFFAIHDFVSRLLYHFQMEVLLIYFVTYQTYNLINYVSIEDLISCIFVYVVYTYMLHA